MTAALAGWPTLGITPAAVPAWRRLSAALEDREPPCSTVPALWFSTSRDDTEAAAHRCRTCHTFTACGEYADAAGERLGVWAGRDRTRRPRNAAQSTNNQGPPTEGGTRND